MLGRVEIRFAEAEIVNDLPLGFSIGAPWRRQQRRRLLTAPAIFEIDSMTSVLINLNRRILYDGSGRLARGDDDGVPFKIYTKTGDHGDTALGDGSRVPKDHPRVTAYAVSMSSTRSSVSCTCSPVWNRASVT